MSQLLAHHGQIHIASILCGDRDRKYPQVNQNIGLDLGIQSYFVPVITRQLKIQNIIALKKASVVSSAERKLRSSHKNTISHITR
jgi:hypothetical protein